MNGYSYVYILVPHPVVLAHSVYRAHPNAWIFHLRDGIWELPGVRDLTTENGYFGLR